MSRFYALVKITLVTPHSDVIAASKARLFQCLNLEILFNLWPENARITLFKILAHSMAVVWHSVLMVDLLNASSLGHQ